MDIPLVPIEQFQLFLVVLARVAGFVSAIPIFAATQSPIQIRVALTVSLTLLFFPVMSPGLPQIPFTPAPFMLFVASELLLGTLLGLAVRLIFTAIEFGATVIGYQMGFAAANVFDPSSERQIALISQFQNVFAILLFLAVDGHHLFLRIAVHSYELLPPGMFNFSGDAAHYLIELTAKMFTLGVQFSAPVLAVLLLSGLILGILARVFPQLNVFLLSFPINIGAAFIVIALTLDYSATLLRREFDNLGITLSTFLNLLNF